MRKVHKKAFRSLAALALGAGMVAGLAACATVPAGQSAAAAQRSLAVPAAAGNADALLFTPAGTGPWPAVIVYPDAAAGLRPTYSEIGRKLADAGYVVLIPNEFYRTIKLDGTPANVAPAIEPRETFARGQQWRAPATDDAVIADARAFIAWLDSQPSVDDTKPISVVGYDVGGAHAFLAARAVPARIGAVAAIAPTAIATARDNSPHLFVKDSRAAYLVEIAQDADTREPGDKDDLRKAFADARLTAQLDVVPANTGFALPDQPAYDAAAADAVMQKVLALLAATTR